MVVEKIIKKMVEKQFCKWIWTCLRKLLLFYFFWNTGFYLCSNNRPFKKESPTPTTTKPIPLFLAFISAIFVQRNQRDVAHGLSSLASERRLMRSVFLRVKVESSSSPVRKRWSEILWDLFEIIHWTCSAFWSGHDTTGQCVDIYLFIENRPISVSHPHRHTQLGEWLKRVWRVKYGWLIV